MAIDKDLFRRALSHFAAGVTVVTTVDNNRIPHGLTATAFSSVSLEPPLVLVCVDKKADTYAQFESAGVFAVNFLSLEQRDLSQRFATHGGDKFTGVGWRPGVLGAPLLDGTIGHVECRIQHWYDAGDHTIMVGEIESADAFNGAPLLHFRHAYRRVGDE
ncbi:MAG TPA: flavin reductase family protein [Candidatus Dormibacteraeota bacterium]|nr:flavin reductase family protein [Candidatus Dormibacteraeota bacterium]